MKNPHSCFLLIVLFLHTSISGFCQGLVINEVQYQNDTTLQDMDGDTPDWIEIYNGGTEIINLKEYSLSDDTELSDLSKLPDLQISPGQFIVIFASGKETRIKNEYHVDFKLKLMSDPVFLLNKKREVIDEIKVQCVPPDKTTGSFPDGSDNNVVLSPTPGRSNNDARIASVDFKPDTLFISHHSGFYPDEIEVTLTSKEPQNKIVYTLDGKVPENDSPVYTDLIKLGDKCGDKIRFANKGDGSFQPGELISKASILRARVYSEGCPASNEISNTYFINRDNAFHYPTPVVSLITDKDNLFDKDKGIYVAGNNNNYAQRGKKWEREAHLEIFDSSQVQITDQDIGIRIHGRGSRLDPQKSLRIYARKEYGDSCFNYNFFPQKDLNTFGILTLSAEKSLSTAIFKDELCHHLVRDMDMDYQAWQAVIVFLNGEYWGIHHLREYQKEEYFRNNHKLSEQDFDLITYEPGTGPVATLGDHRAYNRFTEFILNNNMEDETNFKYVSSVIDINNMVDYFVAQIYLANYDFPHNNLRMWRAKTDSARWRWLFYDCEAGLHLSQSNKLLEYTAPPGFLKGSPEWSVLILQEMLKSRSFRNLFYSKFNEHLNNTFAPETVLKAIHDFESFYTPLLSEHIYRWGKPKSFKKWQENIRTMEQFALQRNIYIRNQLETVFGNPFTVFPIPSKGEFQIDFYDNPAKKFIQILTTEGLVVFQQTVQEYRNFNMTAQLNAGIYILFVQMGSDHFTQKILIIK